MKKNNKKDEFLEHLRKIPIVLVACEKSGLSRNSVYRWKRDDKTFSTEMDEALKEGEELVNDMSESQLLTMIKEKNWSAISFWLRHRNPKFKDKVEITAKFEKQDALNPEQEAIVREALRLASLSQLETPNNNQHDTPTINNRDDDQGQSSQDGNN